MTYTTNSAKETQEIASELAQKYKDGGVILLSGPLGAGKTTFTQGFAQGLGISEHLISPTFILMRSYTLPYDPDSKLYHIDLYRLEGDTHQLDELGLEEIFDDTKNIVLIEWPERLGERLPKDPITVKITPTSEKTREIKVSDF